MQPVSLIATEQGKHNYVANLGLDGPFYSSKCLMACTFYFHISIVSKRGCLYNSATVFSATYSTCLVPPSHIILQPKRQPICVPTNIRFIACVCTVLNTGVLMFVSGCGQYWNNAPPTSVTVRSSYKRHTCVWAAA